LRAFGVEDVLIDPRITIFRGSEAIRTNDDWTEVGRDEIAATSERVGAFELHAGEDAALLLTLEPGSYTVHVDSADGSLGVALVEVYDAREHD
jgi:hypothetical protein